MLVSIDMLEGHLLDAAMSLCNSYIPSFCEPYEVEWQSRADDEIGVVQVLATDVDHAEYKVLSWGSVDVCRVKQMDLKDGISNDWTVITSILEFHQISLTYDPKRPSELSWMAIGFDEDNHIYIASSYTATDAVARCFIKKVLRSESIDPALIAADNLTEGFRHMHSEEAVATAIQGEPLPF